MALFTKIGHEVFIGSNDTYCNEPFCDKLKYVNFHTVIRQQEKSEVKEYKDHRCGNSFGDSGVEDFCISSLQ